MADINDEILAAVNEVKLNIGELKHYLYGDNGFEGDIPQIKKDHKELCETVLQQSKDIIQLQARNQPLPNKAKVGVIGGLTTTIGTLLYLVGAKLGWW